MPNPRYRPPLTTGVGGTEVAGVSFNDWHTNLKSPSRTPLESPEPSNGGRLLRSEYTLARTTSSVIEAGTNCLGFSGQLTSRRGPCKEVVLAAPPRLGPGGRPVPPLSGGHRHAHPIAELAAGRRACVPDRAMRCLKRRLSDIVYRQMLDDAIARSVTASGTGPGGQRDNDSYSSAAGSQPQTSSSDKPHPSPSTTKPRTTAGKP